MKIEDCVAPLKYEEVRVGKAYLHEYKPGHFRLTHNHEQWMGYNSDNHWQCAEFLMEYNFAHGRCITTGIGLGIIQTFLLQNPKVTEVVVYEKNEDVINLFKHIANKNNFDISAIKFVCKDADEMKDEKADCIFLDHWENHDFEQLLKRIRNIANNNETKILWFWPAVLQFSHWRRKKLNLPINLETYQQWVKYIDIKNFPSYLTEEELENISILEKKYDEDSEWHLMAFRKQMEIRDNMRTQMLQNKKNFKS